MRCQVKLLVGFHIPRHQRVFKTLHYLFTHLNETRPQELGLGLAWLAVLLTMKQIGKTSRSESQTMFIRPHALTVMPGISILPMLRLTVTIAWGLLLSRFADPTHLGAQPALGATQSLCRR